MLLGMEPIKSQLHTRGQEPSCLTQSLEIGSVYLQKIACLTKIRNLFSESQTWISISHYSFILVIYAQQVFTVGIRNLSYKNQDTVKKKGDP